MLLDRTWYHYNESGNVRRIINSVEGSDVYTATRFDYAANGQALAYVVGETWDAARTCGTYTITHAREFRYDSGRQRYLDRELDPAQMELWNYSIVGETWTDYDGDQPYGDFTLSGINVTNARSFQPGMATVDPWTSSGSANTSYYHGNQIGSTRMMSDNGGAATGRAAHTAFGERISGTNHRYGYAGAYGYQQHDEFPYMHVGARYYDPATGRFLQRDPIGIMGGLNVYEYVWNAPTMWIDPSGLGGCRASDPRLTGPEKPPCEPNTPEMDMYFEFCIDSKGPSGKVGARVRNVQRWWGPLRRWWFNKALEYATPYLKPTKTKPTPNPEPPPPLDWYCFVAGTLVSTPAGQVPIEHLTVDDRVVASSRVLGASTVAPVASLSRSKTYDVVVLGLSNDELTCTAEHPFWVAGVGWTRAGDLQQGDDLISMNGDAVPVLAVAKSTRPMPVEVYNLTVADDHTYYVGNSEVLVHNKPN